MLHTVMFQMCRGQRSDFTI